MRYVLCCLVILLSSDILLAQRKPTEPTPKRITIQSKKVLAKINGKTTVSGLKASVEVLRDRWGIAHIYAKNKHDLFFAQGYVAAQDRLFQIDLWRRVAVGETAELFGKKALPGDRFARLLKYRGDMQQEWKSYSPDTKEIATAFTDGINAYIDEVEDRLPIEFRIVGFRPKKWQPEDVLGRMSGIIMSRNFRREIFRGVLIKVAGLKRAQVLAPTEPEIDFAPVADLNPDALSVDILSGYYAATKALQFRPSDTESNNWVISGKLSSSGKPMLASDPHRSIGLPSLRYLVHLNAPGWNVIGSGEPGLPGVAIGHNDRIAWGFTIVGTDQADIFVLELNPKNRDQYKTTSGWANIKTIRENVNVKGQKKPTVLKLRYSKHGPIVHETKTHAFVLKWVGSEPGTAAYLGSLAVDRAHNWKEYLQAMKAWKLPTENMIYGDVDGNIGWVAAALTPVRKNYSGLLPVPGTGKYDWTGFLKVADLPQEFNPKRGYIATANHNILPKNYPHKINFDWAEGYRFARVKKRLESKRKFTLEDFKSIQHDVHSLPGEALQRLANTVDMRDPKLRKYVKLFLDWDCELTLESKAGPLHTVWLTELEHAYYGKVVPKSLHSFISRVSNVRQMLDNLENPKEGLFGKNPREKRDAFVRKMFAKSVAIVKTKLGADPNQWSYGKWHTVVFRHPLATLGSAYEKAFNLGPVPRSGDTYTPNNTYGNENYEQTHGGTYRHVLDLADWDKGWATSSPGQSGQPGSPHYDDLFPMWARGEYFPLAFSRAKVEKVTANRLLLMPK